MVQKWQKEDCVAVQQPIDKRNQELQEIRDLVRRLIVSIKVVSSEKLIIQFQSGIVMEQEIRYE